MSELKATTVYDVYWKANSVGEGTGLQVYIKSEADKVIAEFRNEADVYKAKYEQEYDIAVQNEKQLSAMRIEIRHHKYKRCLDKAEMCSARYDAEDAKVNGSGASWEYISKEMKYWERWRWRWLELAEKFKQNSTAPQVKG